MNIAVAAYDWGLGHATRIVPVIEKLLSENNTIIICASKKHRKIFAEHFPDISFIAIPGNSPRLGKGKSQVLPILLFIPAFLLSIFRDKIIARKIYLKYQPEQIISDNRYGFRCRKCFNIIITHQINIRLPVKIKFLQPFVQRSIHRYINYFNECDIPDFTPPDSLTGKLNYPLPKLRCSVKYIGLLSRLKMVNPSESLEKFPSLIFLISGPENQRSVFENKIISEINQTDNIPEYLIIRGLPESANNLFANSLNHASAPVLRALLENARYIICRSGYSTIMDLLSLKKTALLVPTPGQTEQEYLAEYLCQKGLFIYEKQDTFSLKSSLQRLDNFLHDKLV